MAGAVVSQVSTGNPKPDGFLVDPDGRLWRCCDTHRLRWSLGPVHVSSWPEESRPADEQPPAGVIYDVVVNGQEARCPQCRDDAARDVFRALGFAGETGKEEST